MEGVRAELYRCRDGRGCQATLAIALEPNGTSSRMSRMYINTIPIRAAVTGRSDMYILADQKLWQRSRLGSLPFSVTALSIWEALARDGDRSGCNMSSLDPLHRLTALVRRIAHF